MKGSIFHTLFGYTRTGLIIHSHALTGSGVSTPRRKIPTRFRRVSRAHETDPEIVALAIPAGSARAAHGDQVMAHLLRELSNRCMRADGRRARVAVLSCLIARADYPSMTTRPGWEALAEAAGCTSRSVARILAQLEAWGLLGRVAGGRQARYATAGPDGERINEAAVYVLCVPSPLAVVRNAADGAVDINVIPPAVGGTHLLKEELTHTRAREKASLDAAPPRLTQLAAASGGDSHRTPYRPETSWPNNRTTKTPIQRLVAATELRHQIPAFRVMSPKDLRHSISDFLKAGWTIVDIRQALDWTPNGVRWPHSGTPDTANLNRRQACAQLRGWIAYRLGAWRTSSGEPRYSPSQRAEAQLREQRALQAIERTRVLEAQAARAAQAKRGDSPAKIRALAEIRATLRSGRRIDPTRLADY